MQMLNNITRYFWPIFSSRLPRNYDLEVLRKILLLNLIIVIGGISLAALCILAFIQHYYILGSVDLTFLAFMIWVFFYLRKTRRYSFLTIIGTVITGIFYLFLIASGGVDNTAYVWTFTYPLISLFLLGASFGSFMSLLFLSVTITVLIAGLYVDFLVSYNTNLMIRFILAYITVFLFALVMEKTRERVQSRLNKSNLELEKTIGELEKSNKEKQGLIFNLRTSIQEVKVLQGILPICANCKKIRDDKGYWNQVESYVRDHTEAEFSHSICPECVKELYPDVDLHKELD